MGRDEQIGLMVGVRDRLDARMSEWLKSPAIKAALHQVEQTTMEPREECETGCISPMTGLPSLSANK